MTNLLLFIIAVLLFLIWYDMPARRFTEGIALRITKALEAIADRDKAPPSH